MLKKTIVLIIACIVTLYANSQYIKPNNNYGTISNRQSPDSTQWIPTGCGPAIGLTSLRSVDIHKGAIYVDSCNHIVYWYDPKLFAWDTLNKGGGGSGGPFYDSVLMKSVYRARQDSSALATPPGNDQDVIFNDNTKYGADDGFTFSKAFREICVGCNIISGDAFYDGGGVTHGGVWLRSQNGPATVQGDTVTIQATAGSSSIVRLNTNNQERLRFNNNGDLFLPSLSAVTNDTAANKVQVFNTSTKKAGYMNWSAASGFTGITNQDTTLLGNGSTTPLRVNNNLVSYANYFNKGFPFNNQSIFYGTSITFGFSGVALPYPTLTQQALHNTTITNVAVSSCATRTASKKIAAIAPCPLNGPTIGDAAFNNSRWAAATFDTAALFGGIVNSGARDIAAMQFADNIQFYRTSAGSVNSNITTSGSAVTALPADTLADLGSRAVAFTTNIWWKQSITANETVTIANVRGAALYVRVWADSLGGSRIQYAVDGVTIGTYNPNNKIIPGNIFDAPTGFIRGGIQNDVIIIHGLQDTLHTVVLTFLDGGTYGGFDCIGGLKTPQQAALTPMYVLDIEHMSSAGYSVTGGSSAMQDSCSNSKWNALQRAFPEYYAAFIRVNPNYPIGHYDATDIAQTQNNGGGDVGIHPSGLGHRNIALDILNAINPKAINSSGTGNTLDAALTAGNTSSQPMNLSGFSSTDSKLRIGAYEVYPASADVGILGHNVYIDGVNYKWRNSGYGTAILNFNNGILLRTFGNGSAGAIANSSLRTPFVTFDQNVGIGGNISADASIAGATLQAMSTGDVNIPSGNLSVNQASNLGFATLEVHGTGYYNFPQNGNTFLSVHNGTAGTSAAVNIQAVNDVNDIIKMGHYSSATTPNNDLLTGMGYLEETGVAGLGIISDNSVGSISFMTNGLITRAKLDAAGNFMIGHSTSNGNGLLQVDGSGWFEKNQNGNTYLDVKNGNACAACQVNISTVNDLGHAISTGLYSSTTSPNGAFVADGGYVTTTASPGMALIAQNGDLKFAANGIAEQMRLKSGNLGIGTSSPDSALHVVGSGHFTKSLRIDALPAAPGTKTIRYNPANGQVSYGDTATGGGSSGTDSVNFEYVGHPGVPAAYAHDSTLASAYIEGQNSVSVTRDTDSTVIVKLVHDTALGTAANYGYSTNADGRPGWYPLLSATNLYSADGTLTGARQLNGASHNLFFGQAGSQIANFSIYANNGFTFIGGGHFAIGARLDLSGAQVITSGSSSTVSNGVTRVVFDPGSAIAAYTLNLPTTGQDGQVIKIYFGGTVTSGAVVTSLTITATGSGHTIVQSSAPTTGLYGQYISYVFNSSNLIWYREN